MAWGQKRMQAISHQILLGWSRKDQGVVCGILAAAPPNRVKIDTRSCLREIPSMSAPRLAPCKNLEGHNPKDSICMHLNHTRLG